MRKVRVPPQALRCSEETSTHHFKNPEPLRMGKECKFKQKFQKRTDQQPTVRREGLKGKTGGQRSVYEIRINKK